MTRVLGRPPGRAILVRQRAAAEKLRRELFAAQGSLRSPYFRDLSRQLRAEPEPIGLEDVHRLCARADIVYVGDFHANPACQRFAAEVLGELVRRSERVALGVEFVYTRQQRLLDLRQAGVLDDPAFLRRVHYREEWGYLWAGYGALLDRARELGVPVYALDRYPRGGFEGLSARDEHAARRIASIVRQEPDRKLLVLFGESHVSRSHVPRRVEARLSRLGVERRRAIVFQDPDSVYWKLVARGEPLPPAARLDEETCCVFHTSPLAKYEAYRQVLERWRGDVPPEEEVDLTPAVHHLLGVLVGWLGVRPGSRRIEHAAGWAENLGDAFPEVYSGPDAAELLPAILDEHGRNPEEIRESFATLEARGALYDPRSNTMFVTRYTPARAAGEAARFLRVALSGRLAREPLPSHPDPAERAYGAAYDEALAELGGRLVDPGAPAAAPERRGAAAGMVARWMEAHRRFEASAVLELPAEIAEPLRRTRSVRRALASALGRRLGAALFELVRAGGLGRRELRRLFERRLDPPLARRFVLDLLRGRFHG